MKIVNLYKLFKNFKVKERHRSVCSINKSFIEILFILLQLQMLAKTSKHSYHPHKEFPMQPADHLLITCMGPKGLKSHQAPVFHNQVKEATGHRQCLHRVLNNLSKDLLCQLVLNNIDLVRFTLVQDLNSSLILIASILTNHHLRFLLLRTTLEAHHQEVVLVDPHLLRDTKEATRLSLINLVIPAMVDNSHPLLLNKLSLNLSKVLVSTSLIHNLLSSSKDTPQ